MTVLLVSADSEFATLLQFLLTYHGLAVTRADLARPLEADGQEPAMLLLDLATSASEDISALLGSATIQALPWIVLTRPEQRTQTQAQVPQAVAYLPVPVVPRALLATIRQRLAAAACPNRP
jgi:DNA-binding response OmpR family regulator